MARNARKMILYSDFKTIFAVAENFLYFVWFKWFVCRLGEKN